MSDLDIVPRGPRRWHRAAANYVNHPNSQAAELYRTRIGKAIDLAGATPDGAYRVIERGWGDKEPAYCVCSPFCLHMATNTRPARSYARVAGLDQRRCEVCGKTGVTPPIFNAVNPTQEDADNFVQWKADRKTARLREWGLITERNAREREERATQARHAHERALDLVSAALNGAYHIEIVQGGRISDGRTMITIFAAR